MKQTLIDALRAHANELRACAQAQATEPSKELVAIAETLKPLIEEDQGIKTEGFSAALDHDMDVMYGENPKQMLWYIVYHDNVIAKFFCPPGHVVKGDGDAPLSFFH